jgi:hypothetical protein
MPVWQEGRLPETRPADAFVAEGPDGGTYVLVSAPARDLAERPRTTIALLDGSGTVRPGWPRVLDGWSCWSDTGSSRPGGIVVGTDGAVRAVCEPDQEPQLVDLPPGVPDPGPSRVAIALAPDGTPLPGWPVALQGYGWDAQWAMQRDTLVVTGTLYRGDEDGVASAQETWVTWVAPDGSVRRGTSAFIDGHIVTVLGEDGVARVLTSSSAVAMVTLDGLADEWPVAVEPVVSAPAASLDSTTCLVQVKDGRSRTLVLGPDGRDTGRGSGWVDLAQAYEWSGAMAVEAPAVPVVGPDGAAWIIEDSRRAVALARISGDGSAGGTVSVPGRQEAIGRCTAGETGCGVWTVRPVVGGDGTLYLAIRGDGAEKGGTLTAIAVDGSAPSGWPVAAGQGRTFRRLVAGTDGRLRVVTATPRGARPHVAMVTPDGNVAWDVELAGD